jgi:hypothetical protein
MRVPCLDTSWIEIQNWIERFNQPDVPEQTLLYVQRILRKTIYELENTWYQTKLEPWLKQHYHQDSVNLIAQMTLWWVLFTRTIKVPIQEV